MSPGVYPDMSSAEYSTASDWVSASRLKRHLPEYFKTAAPADRSGLDLGIALHTTVLGAGDPIQPVTASSWAGKEAKERRRASYEAGAIPVLEKELPRIEAMAQAVADHPEASSLLSGGLPEVSVFADVDGVQCKARFDYLTDVVGIDLKTTADKPGEQSLARMVLNWGYEIQADHYMRVASAAGLELETFLFVVVCKEPPHHVSVVELDQSFYERATVLRELALERMNHPEMVEPYEGASRVLTVSLPRWARL